MASGTDRQEGIAFRTGKLLRARLALSDFTVIDKLRGFYEHGDRSLPVEPHASAFIKAKWKPVYGSDMLLLDGQEIEPREIDFLPVTDKEDTERGYASHDALVVYLLEEAFTSLRRAVERDDIESATFIGGTELHPALDDRLRLNFGNLDIVHRKKVEPPIAWPAQRRYDNYLLAIFIVLALILIEVWHR